MQALWRSLLLVCLAAIAASAESFAISPGLNLGTPTGAVCTRTAALLPTLRAKSVQLRFADSFKRRRTVAMTALTGGGDKAMAVFVYVSVKPGSEQQFKEASLLNAKNSVQEEGIARFDCVQDKEDSTKFVLVEVYKNDAAPAAHKETAHYAAWRDTVADMMAEPRKAVKYTNIFPASFADWDVPQSLKKGTADGSTDDLLAVHVFVAVKPGTEDSFKQLTIENCKNSIQEKGIARFDFLQEVEDPTKFVLVEVYSTPDAPAAHKETAHYAVWRDGVADMMAEPRSAKKYSNNFPIADSSWRAAKL